MTGPPSECPQIICEPSSTMLVQFWQGWSNAAPLGVVAVMGEMVVDCPVSRNSKGQKICPSKLKMLTRVSAKGTPSNLTHPRAVLSRGSAVECTSELIAQYLSRGP